NNVYVPLKVSVILCDAVEVFVDEGTKRRAGLKGVKKLTKIISCSGAGCPIFATVSLSLRWAIFVVAKIPIL
ncbi:MAG TPA: hypothetical protein VEM32_03630, partial [Geobacteraceae bacterium]|nr:hypothetical protein [Geobacteraceae bacterium]